MSYLLNHDFLTLTAVPPSYYCIGDSHAAIFDGLLFKDNDPESGFKLTKARWQPYFRGEDFFHDGAFGERLTRTLLDIHCLMRADTAVHACFPDIPTGHFGAGGRESLVPCAPHDRVVVVFCGDVDVRDLSHSFADGTDFDLGSHDEVIEALPGYDVRHRLSRQEVEAHVYSSVGSLLEGLRVLRELDFTKLFLHSLPPPGLSEKHGKPARFRYKLSLLANQIFREFCDKNGIHFLSIWNDVTTEGLRASAYDLDDVHLNLAAATITVNRLEAALRR